MGSLPLSHNCCLCLLTNQPAVVTCCLNLSPPNNAASTLKNRMEKQGNKDRTKKGGCGRTNPSESPRHSLSWSCPVVTSSSCSRWVNWSSSSTRSRSEMTAGWALKPSFLMANMTSTIYCTRLSSCASCRMLRRRSKMAAHQTRRVPCKYLLHFKLAWNACHLHYEYEATTTTKTPPKEDTSPSPLKINKAPQDWSCLHHLFLFKSCACGLRSWRCSSEAKEWSSTETVHQWAFHYRLWLLQMTMI